MKKTALEIYSLAVCFIAVVALVISLETSLYSIVRISYPEFTVDQWRYEQYQTNDSFWESNPKHFPPELKGEPAKRPAEAKLTRMREKAYEVILKGEQRNGFQTLVQSLIFFLISSIVFFLHWRLFRSSQNGKREIPDARHNE